MHRYIQNIMQLSKGTRRFIASEALLGIGIGLFTLVLNLHFLAMGINEEQIGKMTSVGTMIVGIFAIPMGLLANRLGRKKILVAGLVLMGIGYALFGLGDNLSSYYIAQIINSIGLTMVITSEIQLIFHYCRSKQEETQSYSLLFAVFTLFTGVGTLLGGYLPKWVGGNTSIYQSSILVAAGVLILLAIVRGLLLPKEQQVLSDEIPPAPSKVVKREWLPSKRIWILSFFLLLSGMSFTFVAPFLNVIVKFRFNWSDEWISLLLTINGFFLFIGSLVMPYMFNRLGVNRSYILIFTMNTLLAFLLSLYLPISALAFLILLRGGFSILLNNMIESQSMSAIDEQERNLFAGMRSVFRSIGGASATYFAGYILERKYYSIPFLVTAISLIVSLLFFLIWVRPILNEKLERVEPS